jgi:hypothetical protein
LFKRLCNTEVYSGPPLKIGVVGDVPEVRENNVNFVSLPLQDINKKEKVETLDAVLIMNNYLSKAAEGIYSDTYNSGQLPFFFIQSKKSYIPFIDEELSYEDAPTLETEEYAIGYYKKSNGEIQHWGFGLYNDKENRINIEDAYTRIFKTVSEIN